MVTKEQYVEALKSSKSVKEISEKIGTSFNKARTLLDYYNIRDLEEFKEFRYRAKSSARWNKYVKPTKEVVIEKMASSGCVYECVEKLGVSMMNFYKLLDDYSLLEDPNYKDLVARGKEIIYDSIRVENKISKEKLEEAVSKFDTVAEILDNLNICDTSFYKLLKEYEVVNKFTKYQDENGVWRRYDFNHDFLKDSADFWYVVGYVLGDGSLNTENNTVSITSKDRHILDDILKAMGYSGEIKNFFSETPVGKILTEYFKLSISSEIYKIRLLEVGIKPRKQFRSDYCVKPPDEFMADFLRGFLDSDGSVMKKKGKKIITLFLSTSEEQLLWIDNFLKNKLGLQREASLECRKGKHDIYSLKYGKADSRILLPWLYYEGHNLSLHRKRDLAKQLLESEDGQMTRYLGIEEALGALEKSGYNMTQAAKLLEVPYPTFTSYVYRHDEVKEAFENNRIK